MTLTSAKPPSATSRTRRRSGRIGAVLLSVVLTIGGVAVIVFR